MVPTVFWEQVRTELTRVKPDIMMLAEASKPELLTNAFDIDYSWPLLSTVKDVFTKNAPASNIRRSWEESCAQFPKAALHMRIVDDHDEDRAFTRYGFNATVAASALMFTLDGVPLIYNGMETADTNQTDGDALFAKGDISWQTTKHPELRGTYRDLIQLRHQYAALCNSRVDWLHNSDEAGLLTFLRTDDRDQLLIVINCSRRPLTGRVNLKNADGFVPVKITGAPSSDDGPLPALQLEGFEWRIYRRPADSSHPTPAATAKRD
jgi:cyclomaltodextrinase